MKVTGLFSKLSLVLALAMVVLAGFWQPVSAEEKAEVTLHLLDHTDRKKTASRF